MLRGNGPEWYVPLTPLTYHSVADPKPSVPSCAGGHFKPDVYSAVPNNIRKHGVKAAVEIANFEASQLYAIKDLIEREQIDCEFTLSRGCSVILHEGEAMVAEEAHKQLIKSGVASLRDVQFTGRRHAERVR